MTEVVAPETPAFFKDGTEPEEEFFDSFSFGGTERWYFDRDKQWVEFKKLTEGDRIKYERLTNKDLTFNRSSGDARIKVDQGGDRRALINIACTGWQIYSKNPTTSKWEPMSFSPAMLSSWLDVTDPRLVQQLDEAIRKFNPWLTEADETVEDIEKAIEELEERKREKILRDATKS